MFSDELSNELINELSNEVWDRLSAQRDRRSTSRQPRNRLRHGQDPEEIVAWMGAVQAQDARAVLWAVGLRLPDHSTAAAVQDALDVGRIVRTHVLRPTWHLVSAADIHWMLQLTAPHVQRRLATYYRRLELDGPIRLRGAKVIERALASGEHRTRTEIGDVLARARLPMTGIRLALLTMHAELEGIVCSGRQRGTRSTYAMLSERAPQRAPLSRDEALAELARRYLRSHAPATVRDFVWWSGLSAVDARRGFEAIGARPKSVGDHVYWRLDGDTRRTASAAVHLLPIYDEYLVAYRDLQAVPRPSSISGVLPQAVIAKGQMAGTWRPVQGRDSVCIHVAAARAMTGSETRALARTAARYGRFFEVSPSLQLG